MRTANTKFLDDEMSVSPYGDPGRMLVHASIYVWSQARQYPLQAWLEAEEILRHAHNEFENDDRIGFVQRVAGGNFESTLAGKLSL
jgi:hypothetical protein